MRPTSSAQQRPVSRRKRLEDLNQKEPPQHQGSIEELNIRVASRTTSNAPKGFLDNLRESVVSRGPDQKIDVKETLKRPLTGLFRRTKHSQNQQQLQQSQQSHDNDHHDTNTHHQQHNNESQQHNLGFEDNMSVLNLNANSEAMALEGVDFSTVDFGKFEDIDISCLARLVCVQSEITDDEDPWTWETLFANVTSELREDWAQFEEEEETGHITALHSI